MISDPPHLETENRSGRERRGEAFIYTAGKTPKGESALQRSASCAREHEVKSKNLQSGCSYRNTFKTPSYQGRFFDGT